MNKVKTLYDVFKTMKDKELFKGNIEVEAAKGDKKILSFSNQFETNINNGETKAKVNVDFDGEGKKVKHESNSEFNLKDCPYHKFHKGMHMHHHGMHGNGGIKSGLSKITFLFSILNNVQIEEKEEKVIIFLELRDVLKEIKDMHKDFHKGIENEEILEYHKQIHEGTNEDFHKHHKFIKELFCSEQGNPLLKIYTNKNKEIEKVEILSEGENTINASLDLVW